MSVKVLEFLLAKIISEAQSTGRMPQCVDRVYSLPRPLKHFSIDVSKIFERLDTAFPNHAALDQPVPLRIASCRIVPCFQTEDGEVHAATTELLQFARDEAFAPAWEGVH